MSEIHAHDKQRGAIDHDLSCMSCGYNLRGLVPKGACPECGTDIARSTQGDLLNFADRNWVGSVYRGTYLLTLADALLVVCILAAIASPLILLTAFDPTTMANAFDTFWIILKALPLAAIGLMFVGVWLITKQEPRVSLTEQAASNRRVARAAVAMVLVLYGLTIALPGPWRTAAWLLLTAAFLAGLCSCLKHLELIGRRLPAQDVVTRAEKRRRRVVRGAIAAAIFFATRAAASGVAATPSIVMTLLKLGYVISIIYLFFATIAAIDSLARFRPFLGKVLDDARTA